MGLEFNWVEEAYFFYNRYAKIKGLTLEKVSPIMIRKQILFIGSYLFAKNKAQKGQITLKK